MYIKICKWFNNVQSPVIFMIDDLANTWVDINKDNKINLSEDWGFAQYGENSSVKYLEEEILIINKEIKVTFFVPVDKRVGMIKDSKIKTISKPINFDDKSKLFFKQLYSDKRYELAYHGTTHGKVGNNSNDFKQEWETYTSLQEALSITKKGIEIYEDTVGEKPLGGKYCGYTSNKYSDDSIDKSNFLWWCRFCNLQTNKAYNNGFANKYIYGTDLNTLTNYDIKYFGENNVIDIPTTVDGGILSSLYNNDFSFKSIVKFLLKPYIKNRRLKYIEYLLKNKLVLSIQEHISPARDDGKIQTPNIFTDKESLMDIFKYLKSKHVWYCTGTELASYVYYRDNIKLKLKDNKIKTNYKILKKYKFAYITIEISGKNKIISPNGKEYLIIDNIVTLPLEEGEYSIV